MRKAKAKKEAATRTPRAHEEQENNTQQGGTNNTRPSSASFPRPSGSGAARPASLLFGDVTPVLPPSSRPFSLVQIQRQYSCCWATKKHSEYKQEKNKANRRKQKGKDKKDRRSHVPEMADRRKKQKERDWCKEEVRRMKDTRCVKGFVRASREREKKRHRNEN
jgi:hypothetical protein